MPECTHRRLTSINRAAQTATASIATPICVLTLTSAGHDLAKQSRDGGDDQQAGKEPGDRIFGLVSDGTLAARHGVSPRSRLYADGDLADALLKSCNHTSPFAEIKQFRALGMVPPSSRDSVFPTTVH